MKKKFLKSLMLTTSLCVLLSACSSTEEEQTSDSTTTEETPESAAPSGEKPDGSPGGMMGGGAVDKSSDTELQTMISEIEGEFEQLEYTDSETGETLTYNLYTPENYDPSKSYPLVLYISDSSTVGEDAMKPLSQGYGGLIWATEEEQAKHESFVLVPQYPDVIIDDHGSFTTTEYIEMTKRLLDSVTSNYSIDDNRLYATGQSMGCMTLLYLSAQYPDLFAGQLFVSGQWDASTLESLADQNFFYIAAAGDEKASTGQEELLTTLENEGASISTATWDATWSTEESTAAVESILSEGNNINFATFELGTVLPEGVEVGTSEHMYSFDYAYKVEAVRDWLFEQVKE
ncbi:alpha/beta hydrolase-fold protein [Metabacillus litoralis]|uniref:carboxylesterase family protein n=1 Tax=Metabacillus litoralis TaxID=152268 RepID=UPI00203B80DA|nr:alpha/beta hydrolase-fold protein [Metabacillus litoralis]MCM3411849.1 alpha/beta hydrolase-fold protein [Metabacillus litoralis]